MLRMWKMCCFSKKTKIIEIEKVFIENSQDFLYNDLTSSHNVQLKVFL